MDSNITAVASFLTIQNGYGANDSGGGVRNFGSLTLNNSAVINNTTNSSISLTGGGIYNTGSLTLTNSQVSGNTAVGYGGAGIDNQGSAVLNNSTVSNNQIMGYHNSGGGIRNSGSLVLNNSTVSGNVSSFEGGGIINWGTLALNSSTISYNSAEIAGGIEAGTGTISMRNTIIANNSSSSGTSPDCGGVLNINSLGYNLIGNSSGCPFSSVMGDRLNVDARLGTLVGSPSYHPLLFGSAAIDGGDPTGCMGSMGPLLTDQRAMPRVRRCDIGAYEYQGDLYSIFLPLVNHNFCSPPYADNFSNTESGWPIVDNGTVRWGYVDGEYSIWTNSPEDFWVGATSGVSESNYKLTVDVRNDTWYAYGAFGLAFGISDDWSQFYAFEIDTGGNYLISKVSGSTWTTLAAGTSDAIHTIVRSVNKLTIERNGALLNAYVNDQLIANLSDSSYLGYGNLGVLANTSYNHVDMDVRFDNFAVYPVGCSAVGTANSQIYNRSPELQPELDMDKNAGVAYGKLDNNPPLSK